MHTLRHLPPALRLPGFRLPVFCLLGFCLTVATARAADPAKTVFGVELGTRFAFPACARGEDTMTRRHCYSDALTAKLPWGATEYHVFYPRTESAPYARGEMVLAVINGHIEAMHINTWGIEGQGTALEALTKKYGPPARSRTEKIKALRSRHPSRFAEWELLDFSVRLDGTTSTIDWGRITLATNRYRQLAEAHGTTGTPR